MNISTLRNTTRDPPRFPTPPKKTRVNSRCTRAGVFSGKSRNPGWTPAFAGETTKEGAVIPAEAGIQALSRRKSEPSDVHTIMA